MNRLRLILNEKFTNQQLLTLAVKVLLLLIVLPWSVLVVLVRRAQVMQTERLIYLVTEYASGGEIYGKLVVRKFVMFN